MTCLMGRSLATSLVSCRLNCREQALTLSTKLWLGAANETREGDFTLNSPAYNVGEQLNPMSRPVGVTILAIVNIAAAFIFIASDLIVQNHPDVGLYVALVVVSIVVSYALWNLQSWVRWFMVVTYGIGLLQTIAWVVTAVGRHDTLDILLALSCSIFLIGSMAYMFSRRVRVAFAHPSVSEAHKLGDKDGLHPDSAQ